MCLCGRKSEKIKREGKFYSTGKKREINVLHGTLENSNKKKELFSVPKGKYKLFPRTYYRCVETENGDIICFE